MVTRKVVRHRELRTLFFIQTKVRAVLSIRDWHQSHCNKKKKRQNSLWKVEASEILADPRIYTQSSLALWDIGIYMDVVSTCTLPSNNLSPVLLPASFWATSPSILWFCALEKESTLIIMEGLLCTIWYSYVIFIQ